jgi:hypothetical protein
MITAIRPTLRRLARARGFSAVSILTLGLGIAGSTAAFSVVNAVLLRPLLTPRQAAIRRDLFRVVRQTDDRECSRPSHGGMTPA